MATALRRRISKQVGVPMFYLQSRSVAQLEKLYTRCSKGILPMPPMRPYKNYLIPDSPLSANTYYKVFLVPRPKRADLVRAANKLGIKIGKSNVQTLKQVITQIMHKNKFPEPIVMPKQRMRIAKRNTMPAIVPNAAQPTEPRNKKVIIQHLANKGKQRLQKLLNDRKLQNSLRKKELNALLAKNKMVKGSDVLNALLKNKTKEEKENTIRNLLAGRRNRAVNMANLLRPRVNTQNKGIVTNVLAEMRTNNVPKPKGITRNAGASTNNVPKPKGITRNVGVSTNNRNTRNVGVSTNNINTRNVGVPTNNNAQSSTRTLPPRRVKRELPQATNKPPMPQNPQQRRTLPPRINPGTNRVVPVNATASEEINLPSPPTGLPTGSPTSNQIPKTPETEEINLPSPPTGLPEPTAPGNTVTPNTRNNTVTPTTRNNTVTPNTPNNGNTLGNTLQNRINRMKMRERIGGPGINNQRARIGEPGINNQRARLVG